MVGLFKEGCLVFRTVPVLCPALANAVLSLRHSLTWHMLGAQGHILILVQAYGSWMFRDASFGSDPATGLS